MPYEEYVPRPSRGYAVLREFYDWFESGITAVVCLVLVFAFVGRGIGVKQSSMFPTLHDGDRLICTPLYGEVKERDIVVITQPNGMDNKPLIKRVIALGGQTVDIDSQTGDIYIDGRRLYEDYIVDPIKPGSVFQVQFPQTVPPGHVFVMGDNRNNSLDSRSEEVGMVDERYILGKVVYRVTPYERFGYPYKSN